jgi:hypothetical protein|tara:strand:- start:87 stop:200 length:114 start_codon:yes stop_codon:yes gene_type:complete
MVTTELSLEETISSLPKFFWHRTAAADIRRDAVEAPA